LRETIPLKEKIVYFIRLKINRKYDEKQKPTIPKSLHISKRNYHTSRIRYETSLAPPLLSKHSTLNFAAASLTRNEQNKLIESFPNKDIPVR
jgi:hypothetical protein